MQKQKTGTRAIALRSLARRFVVARNFLGNGGGTVDFTCD
jgi:hypothetical protein